MLRRSCKSSGLQTQKTPRNFAKQQQPEPAIDLNKAILFESLLVDSNSCSISNKSSTTSISANLHSAFKNSGQRAEYRSGSKSCFTPTPEQLNNPYLMPNEYSQHCFKQRDIKYGQNSLNASHIWDTLDTSNTLPFCLPSASKTAIPLPFPGSFKKK